MYILKLPSENTLSPLKCSGIQNRVSQHDSKPKIGSPKSIEMTTIAAENLVTISMQCKSRTLSRWKWSTQRSSLKFLESNKKTLVN